MRILSILLILLAFACKNKKEVASTQEPMQVETEAKTTMEEEVNQKETPQKIDFPDNAIARIQRTACFGLCPIYTLTVFNDGTASLHAEKWTDLEGDFTASVSQDKYKDLMQMAEEINYFKFDNVYNSEAVTDLPSTITTLRRGDELKQIINRYQGPEELNDFEKFFDKLYLKSDWKKK